MALVCIPRHQVEKLKQLATSGGIDLKKLYDQSSKERRDFFTKHTDPELGKLLNTEFEKAMVAKQQDALIKWTKMVFSPDQRTKPQYKTVLGKIQDLDDLGVLNPQSEKAFLEDLVSDKLGINVTADEVKAISIRAKKIDEAQTKLGDDLGSPTKLDENLAFFQAKKEMDDYLQSHNPAPKLRVATGTIGRGMMLASVKSPLLNIGSNIEVGLTEAIGRRIAAGSLKGTDSKLAREYIHMVNKVYQKTGYDLSRMTSLADTGVSGGRVLDDAVHAQGKGAVRKAGRVVEDVVFKQLMGAPDAVFGAVHFADSVNLNALKFAKDDPIKAKALMQDALKLEPKTPQGELLRAQGILDAQVATWTNKSWATDVSLGVRKILNNLTGDLRAGDYLLPFVKTPANVIATGLDYAGLGVPKALFKLVKAVRNGDLKDAATMGSISRDIVRSSFGLTAAVAVALNIDPENFVGAYDPARAQIEQLKNSRENSIKIGNKWVSTDWFGPLAVPLNGIMYARKYGNTNGEVGYQYAKGTLSTGLGLPGVKDITDFTQKQKTKEGESLVDAKTETANYVTDQIASRLIPSILSDVAKATDPYERKSEKGIQGVKSKIPGLRQSLPIKQSVLGQDLKSEPGASTILFGTRVRSDKTNAVTKEITKVTNNTGKSVNFTDWDKSSNKQLAELRQKLGNDKYDEAKKSYGQKLQTKLKTTMESAKYKELDDSDRLLIINRMDSQIIKDVFKQYSFKPTKTKSNSLFTSFK